MSNSKQLLCAVTVAVFGFSGAALAQQAIMQPAPVVVYQPGSVIVKEVPSTTRRDGTSLAEDKGP